VAAAAAAAMYVYENLVCTYGANVKYVTSRWPRRERWTAAEHLDHDELQSQRPQTRINTQIMLRPSVCWVPNNMVCVYVMEISACTTFECMVCRHVAHSFSSGTKRAGMM